MRNLILTIAIIVGSTAVAAAQTEQVCISQDTANKCADAIDRVAVLEDAVKVRDKAIEDLKVELARQTQKAVDNEATVIRLTTMMEFLLKAYTKPKKFGLINF